MKTPIVLIILIAGSILATPAWAGTPATPEVADVAGDAPGSVDLVSAWVTNTATDLVLTVKVADLSQSSPFFDNEGAYHNYYYAEFTHSTTGAKYFLEAQISFIDSETMAGVTTNHLTGAVHTNVGTQYHGGQIGTTKVLSGSVNVDPATNTIVFTIARGTTFTSGSLIGLTLKTSQDASVYESDPGAAALVGGGAVLKDTAPVGRTYTLV